MTTEQFKANTQYNDLTGTAAADWHDDKSLEQRFKAAGLIQDGEHIIGTQIYASEAIGGQFVSVSIFLDQSAGHDDTAARIATGEPLKVRKVSLEMPIAEVFSYFKRLEISISSHGLIDGHDIEVTE